MLYINGRGISRPPSESSLGKSFSAEPKALAVVYQQADSGSSTIAEYKDRSLERILVEFVPANGSQPIDAFTEIDKLNTDKNTCRRRDLKHDYLPNSWVR